MTGKEIKDNAKNLHDNLTEDYRNGLLDKETFDYLHGKIWNDMEAELIAGGFIQPPKPERDLEKEIDELKIKVKALEKGK